MIYKKERADLPNLTSWTRHLTFKCKNEIFQVYIVYLQSHNLTSLQLQNLASQLPQEEIDCLSYKSVFNRQRDYILGRYAARMAVQTALGIQSLNYVDKVSNFCILPGVFNQPVIITQGLDCGLGVSISHQDQSAVAVAFDTRHPMAIDFEHIDEEQTSELEQFVNLQKWDDFNANLLKLSKIEMLYLFWTCMEALGKALGCGLTVPLEFLKVASCNLGVPIKSLEGKIQTWFGIFQNCPQYSWYAWKLTNSWMTFVAPSQSNLILCESVIGREIPRLGQTSLTALPPYA